MGLFRKRPQHLRDATIQLSAREEAREKTSLLGDEIFEFVRQAIKDNKVYNVRHDGSIDDSLGQMRVVHRPLCGDQTTIIVIVCCSEVETSVLGIRGISIFQFDVDMAHIGKELYIYDYPDGPGLYSSIDDLTAFKAMLRDRIITYRQYPLNGI